MKARVKTTDEIVEVVYNGFYYESIKDERIFDKIELEIIPKTKDPNYWTRLEHQAAIAAMQGILSNPAFPKHSQEGYYKKNVVNNAYEYAHTLVEKMKEEK